MDDGKSKLFDSMAMERVGLRDFIDGDDLKRWLDEHGGGELGEERLRAALAHVPGNSFPGIVMARAWLNAVDRHRAEVN